MTTTTAVAVSPLAAVVLMKTYVSATSHFHTVHTCFKLHLLHGGMHLRSNPGKLA